MTVGTAGPISLAEAHSDDAPSFFTRGVGNSTAASDITMYVLIGARHRVHTTDTHPVCAMYAGAARSGAK
jgi:hypothetical protein